MCIILHCFYTSYGPYKQKQITFWNINRLTVKEMECVLCGVGNIFLYIAWTNICLQRVNVRLLEGTLLKAYSPLLKLQHCWRGSGCNNNIAYVGVNDLSGGV